MSKTVPAYDKLLRDLAKILDETNLTEIEYESDGSRVRVARQGQFVTQLAPSLAAPAPHQSQTAPDKAPLIDTKPSIPTKSVKSPMVGTAYLSPAPGEKTFVSVGSKVKTGDTLLIIEAMKVMNPIRCTEEGIVKAILVNNGEPVEFDQPLITLE